jgi:hypothetical protein
MQDVLNCTLNGKKLLRSAISTGAILLTLLSCDPVIDYEKAIENASTDELLLVRNNPLIFDFEDATLEKLLLDSSVLAPNNRQLLNEGFDIGGDVGAYNDCPGYLEEGDTIYVWLKDQGSYELVLQITQENFANTYRKLSKSSCECIYVITQDMVAR